MKSRNTEDKVKTTRMVKTTIHLISNKTTLHVQNRFCTLKVGLEKMFVFLFTLFFSLPLIFTSVAASTSHFLTAAI